MKYMGTFQPRHTNVKQSANMAEQSIVLPDPPRETPNTSTPNTTTTIEPPAPNPSDHTEGISPTGGKAELQDVGKDYMDFLFPPGGSTSINLDKPLSTTCENIPANYISMIQPTANIGKSTPLNSTNTTYAENDEIFTHNILEKHTKITKTFQADWGAKIIIVNDKSLFTEFTPYNASLNPVDGNPIYGIKGYGTIICCIDSRLAPVRECTFMPKKTTMHIYITLL